MYSKNIQPKSKVRGSLPLINPEPERHGVYQWQTFDDQGWGSYICGIHRSSCDLYDIYYGDAMPECYSSYLQWNQFMFSTFLLTHWPGLLQHCWCCTWLMNSNSAINTQKRKVCTSITTLLDGFMVMCSKKPDIHHNGGWG